MLNLGIPGLNMEIPWCSTREPDLNMGIVLNFGIPDKNNFKIFTIPFTIKSLHRCALMSVLFVFILRTRNVKMYNFLRVDFSNL